MRGLLIISGLGILAMLSEIFRFKKLLLPLVLIGIAAAWGFNFMEWKQYLSIPYFDNMIGFDKPAIAFSGIILVTSFFWFILANDYFEEDSNQTDHFSLVLFSLVGALMLTSFRNMTTLFLGIEIMSIPLYVLAASKKADLKSNEAGFKYLIMGSFASAFLLFGIALIYGASGSFDIVVIKNYIQDNLGAIPVFFKAGVVMILVAMCFKVSAAPFHFWTPDVYEGSPTLITAFMSTIVKTAAFAAFLRLFMLCMPGVSEVWVGILAAVVALSLIIANFSAAMQWSVKRMLAYSSISHAGFMLMVIVANLRNNMSLDAMIYYSLAYSAGSIAAFGIVYNVARQEENEAYESFNGFGKRNPLMAFCMTVAMLSLAGIPITAGFFAKYFVFNTLIGTQYSWLLILGVITSGVSVYYYLKLVIAMYFRRPEEESEVPMEASNKAVILVTTAATLVIGALPGLVTGIFSF